MPSSPVSPSAPPENAVAIARGRLVLYTGAFVAFQAIALIACLLLPTTQWFLRHDGYPGMLMTGYSVRQQHAECRIVLYGDSSALTGLDPQIVEQITGLKTCNLSEGTTIQDVVGLYPLDEYLKHNRRPEYLLATYTPSIYNPYTVPFHQYQVEGLTYAFEYVRTKPFYKGLLHHKKWVIDYALWVGRALIQNLIDQVSGPHAAHPNPRDQREARNGIWPYPVPPETHCVRTERNYKPEDFRNFGSSAEEFRQKYSTGGTRVILDISPVPDCDVLYNRYAEINAGLHDNTFERLPISFFNEGDVHFSAAGSQYISRKAAEQILALEHANSAASSVGAAAK